MRATYSCSKVPVVVQLAIQQSDVDGPGEAEEHGPTTSSPCHIVADAAVDNDEVQRVPRPANHMCW